MKTNGRYDRLFNAFDSLRVFLEDKRKMNQFAYDEETKFHNGELLNFGIIISESTNTITTNSAKLKELVPRLDDKNTLFDNNEATIVSMDVSLNTLVLTMESNEESYTADRDRIMKAIKGC